MLTVKHRNILDIVYQKGLNLAKNISKIIKYAKNKTNFFKININKPCTL